MAIMLTNNAFAIIPQKVSSVTNTITVAAGEGSKFPILNASDYFQMTIADVFGNYEIVKVTARTDDTMTVERGQAGTIPIAFPANSRAEVRVTVDNIFNAVGDYLLL